MEDWQCSYCDTINDVGVAHCAVCEAKKPSFPNEYLSEEAVKPSFSNEYLSEEAVKPSFSNENISEGAVKSFHRNDGESEDKIYLKARRESVTPESPICSDSPAFWNCAKCTMRNLYDIDKCSVCDAHGPHCEKWECVKCTMLNSKDDGNCSVCFTVNPSLKTCELCNRVYSGKCEYCAAKRDTKEEYIKENPAPVPGTAPVVPNVDKEAPTKSWTCENCNFDYSYDVDQCAKCANPGPLYNKWKCERCSYVNDNDAIVCCACGLISNRNFTKFLGDMTLETVRTLTAGMIPTNDRPGSDKVLCGQCHRSHTRDGDKLCQQCKQEFYVCPSEWCQTILSLEETECRNCGMNKNRYIPTFSQFDNGWKCSWMKCDYYNGNNCVSCAKCACDRAESEGRKECPTCGWIGPRHSKCQKCGFNN